MYWNLGTYFIAEILVVGYLLHVFRRKADMNDAKTFKKLYFNNKHTYIADCRNWYFFRLDVKNRNAVLSFSWEPSVFLVLVQTCTTVWFGGTPDKKKKERKKWWDKNMKNLKYLYTYYNHGEFIRVWD